MVISQPSTRVPGDILVVRTSDREQIRTTHAIRRWWDFHRLAGRVWSLFGWHTNTCKGRRDTNSWQTNLDHVKMERVTNVRHRGNQPGKQQPGSYSQPPKQSQQPTAKKLGGHLLPFSLCAYPGDLELRFYQQYDESYLFNRAVTIMYAVEQGAEFKQKVQTYLDGMHGGSLTQQVLGVTTSGSFFMTLHQFESLFALLIAPFQIFSSLFLTAYTTDGIKAAIRQFLDGDLAALTDGAYTRGQEREFLSEALYLNSRSSSPEEQATWDENLDNALWLIHRGANAYLENLTAYNSYKHGLRAVTRPNATFVIR